jgi:MFS family permease
MFTKTSEPEPILVAPDEPRAKVALSDARKWTLVVLLALGAVIAYTSRMGLGVSLAVPSFVKIFNLSNVDRGVLNSAFFWVFAALQIPTGWVVDRFGVKRPYTVSFFLWGAVTLTTGLTHTLPQLITVRVLTGASEAIIMPASYSWIRRNFEEKRSGLALGIYMLGTKIGPALGAPAAAWLIMTFNWRILYILLGVLAMFWLIPWVFLVTPDGPAKTPASMVEKRHTGSEPLVPLRELLVSPVVWGGFVVNFCYCYFVFYFMTWMPAFFVEYRHLSLSKMGFYTFFSFAGMGIVNIAAGWAADWLIGRGRNAVTVRKTFTIVAFVIACTELLAVYASSAKMALFWSVISLSGLGLASGNSLALCRVTLISRTAVGRVTGIAGVSTALAGITSPILSGWLLQKTGSYQGPMQAIWFFQVVAIVTCLVALREKYSMVPVTKYASAIRK